MLCSVLVQRPRSFAMSAPPAQPPVKRGVGKKWVIACDGTWQNSDGSEQTPSNVVRIIRALKHFDDSGVPQMAYYQRGAGTDSDIEDHLYGGFTGSDVAEHVREAYAMLANNFNPETHEELTNGTGPLDEIVLLGFSRGAFTARAIASLISDIGLLTKIGMEDFWGIFEDFKNQDIEDQKGQWFKKKFPNFGKDVLFTDPEYKDQLVRAGMTRWGMKIRAIGVWDTVGALGIPIDWGKKNVKEFSFVNTKIARHVQHGFQALALDEHRGLFTPTLWELPDDTHNLKKLKQCWFPGVHSNIGGSYPDAGISNITLAWMISQLEDSDGGILAFDQSYLDKVQDWNTQGYITRKEAIRPWGMGRLYDSASPNSVLTAAQGINPITRTPGQYCQIDLKTGLQLSNRPLTNTNEYIHRSVRVRIDGGGLGPEDDPLSTTGKVITGMVGGIMKLKEKFVHTNPPPPPRDPIPAGPYQSAALTNYQLQQSESVRTEVDHSTPGPADVFWKAKAKDGGLPEDQLGRTEIRMLQRSIATAKAFSGGH